ncbi:hypothetical protein CBR_g28640 [Chara braunii]|uniref:RRM domain-containing protein n=1 Tax=Chara braunii TaxID=69332 RepID=A0A388L9D8_CHABU|nr:hypothetical protein CBR_g28640 [Chara braunii]|eukprot:GBG78925.1 hypothetical protein CBR_g28640 [Chara braunii]
MSTTNPKTTVYVGGLEENVNEAILHSAFIPFGDVKDVNIPLDQSTQKHRGFGFVEFQDKEDAAAAINNMHNAELYGRVLTVNYAQPMKIKGGEQGWASQPGKVTQQEIPTANWCRFESARETLRHIYLTFFLPCFF